MLFLDTETVPKAVSDPQIFYEAVFKYHTIFQEKLTSLGFNYQTWLKANKKESFQAFQDEKSRCVITLTLGLK